MASQLPEFTVGIEEEYQIIDPETRELSSYIQEILEEGGYILKDQIKPEFMQSQVEVGSSICHNMKEARAELIRLRGAICELADKYDAMVHFDDCHSTGFLGERGRGTHEHCGLFGKIDLTTGTLGKALGGASGGFTSGRKEIIELLRQRSRPYLFSNTLAPTITAATLRVFEILKNADHRQ